MPGKVYHPELDALRFVAFFCVFVHHFVSRSTEVASSHPLRSEIRIIIANAGAFGLSLFFTLSAFLICDLLLRERETTGRVAIIAFYKRRALRIWPLYLLGLGLGSIWAHFTHTPYLTFFVCCILVAGNWYAYATNAMSNPASVIWSISVEEQFYLVWPLIAARASRRTMYGFCCLLILVANLLLIYYGRSHAPSDRPWFNTFVQFEMFATGILLALTLKHRTPQFGWSARVMLLLVTAVAWALAVQPFHAQMLGASTSAVGFVMGYALIAIGCASLLLGFLGAPLVPKPLVYLGKVSYGLYVFHALIRSLIRELPLPSPVTFVLALGGTILVASISYRWFETPFLRLKRRSEVIHARPI